MAFRRVDLPNDPDRSSSLEELGYFIDKNDKIARIDDPSKGYHFKANKNPRYVQTRHEDFEGKSDFLQGLPLTLPTAACRRVVEERLLAENILIGHIPLAAAGDEAFLQTSDKRQAPIFFSNFISYPEKCERLILLVGTANHDPHIISHNILDNHGINAGSVLGFVKDAHARDRMGVIIANTGQCVWSKTLRKAVTYATYDALPRDKATDPSPMLDQENPYVFGSPMEHLSVLFGELVLPTMSHNRNHPKLYIICINDAVHDVLKFMQSKWSEYGKFTAAIVACNGTIDKNTDMYDPGFVKFWSERCKHYWTDALPLDTPIEVVSDLPNYFSSGAVEKRQNVFYQVYETVLNYFDHLHANPSFKLPPFVPVQTFNDLDDGDTQNTDGGAAEGWA